MSINDMYWAFYRWFRDKCFHPVYYRFFGHRFHIIKTGLKPCPWYDVDSRMLYGMMNMARWFVENDMRICDYNEWDKEIEDFPPDQKENHMALLKSQRDSDNEIIAIVDWWKNYENRRREIDVTLMEWADYRNKFAKGEFNLNVEIYMNDAQKAELNKIGQRLTELEEKLDKEEEEYLIRLVKVRRCMWS